MKILNGCKNHICSNVNIDILIKLNSDKTEVIWFGSKANLVKLKAIETVQPVHVVRGLGVLLDAQLTMKQHINKLTAVLPTTATATNSSTCWTRSYNAAGTSYISARLL